MERAWAAGCQAGLDDVKVRYQRIVEDQERLGAELTDRDAQLAALRQHDVDRFLFGFSCVCSNF